jgi:hypothetical protein
MQIIEQLREEGANKLRELVESNDIKNYFLNLTKINKNEIEEKFNDIAKKLGVYRNLLREIYIDYFGDGKFSKGNGDEGQLLYSVENRAYFFDIFENETAFLKKLHSSNKATKEEFLTFFYYNFVTALMGWSEFLGSYLEVHIELYNSFVRNEAFENSDEQKAKMEDLLHRYGKIIDFTDDFENNYATKFNDEVENFDIRRYLIYHIYIRHIEETQIDESGTCFPKDFDNEKLCNLLITILNKPHFSELGNKNAAVYVYHEEQIYTVVFRGNLIHSFYPNEKKAITKLPDRYKEGGSKEVINLKEVPE